MRRLLLAMLCASGAFAPAVWAEPLEMTVDPASLTCLSVPERSALAYPTKEEGQADAVVRVQLDFVAADRPPEVTVLSNSATASFADAVASWVAGYRLTCLAPGHRVRVEQTFDFVGSKPAEARAVAFLARQKAESPEDLGCRVEGLNKLPVYPRGVNAHAAVIVRVRFEAADAAPQVTVLYDGDEPRFARAVVAVVEDYRLRCEKPLVEPLAAKRIFLFEMSDLGGSRIRKSLTLPQLLGNVERLDEQKVRFDLTRMACPFDVKFSPREPYDKNAVDADLTHHPERLDFAQWLSELVLVIPPAARRSVIGRETTVSVPCAVLDLT